VSKEAFAELLRTLGQRDVLTQDHSGLLLHGHVGDRIVNHYTFYAAFSADEEFRIVSGGKTLGTLPVSQMMAPGQRILFGGRTWLIEAIDEEHKTIHATPAKGGAPPLFNGGGGRVHTRVRQRMRDIYLAHDTPPFLDATARRFLEEGREAFATMALADCLLLDQGSQAILVTWLGDAANEAIACLLMSRGVHSFAGRLGVEIHRAGRSLDEIEQLLADISSKPAASVDELLANASNLSRQKWDGLLSPHLLRQSYASSNLDLDEAQAWLRATCQSRSH
jgi:ATP-dependent Lhr-like helicase